MILDAARLLTALFFQENHVTTELMSDEKKPTPPSKAKVYAKRKVMELTARRDHSENELRTKLRGKPFETDCKLNCIYEAIEFAKIHGLLGIPHDPAHRWADMLHRRNKGIHYINDCLKEKSLPAVEIDCTLELEKARTIVKNRFDEIHEFSRCGNAKVGCFLAHSQIR